MTTMGFVIAVALGARVASRVIQPFVFREPRRADIRAIRSKGQQGGGFEPLDLGEDPMQWPSAREWPSSGKLSQEWPSRSWDDEHFGTHWERSTATAVEDAGFHAMAQRRTEASPERVVRRESARAARSEAARREGEGSLRTGAAQSRDDARARAVSARTSGVRRAEPAPRAAPPAPSAGPSSAAAATVDAEAPSRAELEDRIARVGLAGTVEHIMKRTGWDFRKAAHYLAKTRQG